MCDNPHTHTLTHKVLAQVLPTVY